MEYKSIAEQIISLKNADLAFRDQLVQSGKLSAGYHPEMQELHNHHAAILDDIIDQIGYPTTDKVGEEASEAAWLVIQHAIGQPGFMRKCVKLLEHAVRENQADPKNLAYLTDRIAVLEEKPQLYGTQFDWDESGNLSPNLFDSLVKVNERRKAIGLNTLEEQTGLIRKQAQQENQLPPADPVKRKQELEAWKSKTGWKKSRMTFADFSTRTTDAKGICYLEPKTKQDGFLTDYFNAIRTASDLEAENQSFQKIEKLRSMSASDDQWYYCEEHCSGNENDAYCWIDSKSYTPSFLIHKATGKVYLHYILDAFNPHVEIELDELKELLEVWKNEFLGI